MSLFSDIAESTIRELTEPLIKECANRAPAWIVGCVAIGITLLTAIVTLCQPIENHIPIVGIGALMTLSVGLVWIAKRWEEVRDE